MPEEPAYAHTLRARKIAEERASGECVPIAELPAGASIVNVLGVDYVHTANERLGDLYLTTAGFPYAEYLQPDNWYEPNWFRSQREKLEGSGLVYAVPTKPIRGENLSLVVKFSRVGEKVPIDTNLIENVLCCEFNGPFEEFALVEELRHSRRGTPGLLIRTQTPPRSTFHPSERSSRKAVDFSGGSPERSHSTRASPSTSCDSTSWSIAGFPASMLGRRRPWDY